jgi:virginiamycin A acetyltransferase
VISIHPTARVSRLADVEDSTRGSSIVIEANVVIDSFVKIKPAGGTGNVVIGQSTVINSGCVLYTGNGIAIGMRVAIAANCVLAPVNHEYRDRSRSFRDQGFSASKGGIVIESDVWIGAGCVILDGSIIRTGCVIGAMSLVRGEVEAFSVQCGNPLRLIRRISNPAH